MSRRRSTGDLVPRDITEILAREARAQRGLRKPGSSLGQAFSWLKGNRRKKSAATGRKQSTAVGADVRTGPQAYESARAGLKGNEDAKRLTVHFTTSQHYQENVFIEGSRPQYLEELHIEAQEGLKILQQEEDKNGVNFPDDESVASTDTLRPELDISPKDIDGCPESRSTDRTADTTTVSDASTRLVLNRQGSTFKPLNPVKRAEKNKKRSRRTTIMGIPNQVQKELALQRSSTFQQLPSHEKQLFNNQPRVVVSPTVDEGTPVLKKEGARVHLSELEASKDEQLLRKNLGVEHQDEQTVNQQGTGARLHPTSLRPKSLAVPGMTSSSFSSSMLLSFLQEPQGPVMSVSPQATYLSTIIPNAILPASVEVIEIDRGSSRTGGCTINHGGSVRTVSKSSLACGETSVSPLLSRRSDGDGSQTYHSQDCRPVSTLSLCSNRSESQSSKTLISNSSPASSKSSTHSSNSSKLCVNGHETKTEQSAEEPDLVSLSSSISMISSPSTKSEFNVSVQGSESSVSGLFGAVEDPKNKQNSSRSLSVTKTKQPPAPPRRTNSLHSNRVRGTIKVLVEGKDVNGSVCADIKNNASVLSKEEKTSVSEEACRRSASTSIDAGGATQSSSSSPQKALSEEDKFERTLSPSSGYSSQSGTPTLSQKGMTPTSPEKQKQKPVKPERSASRPSSAAASPSSSLTSLSSSASDPANPDVAMCSPSLPAQEGAPTFASQEPAINKNATLFSNTMRELLNIPLPPKVKAPCPPPPETWVHNRYCFELLCAPSPNGSKSPQKPMQVQDSINSQINIKAESEEEKQKQSTTNKSQSTESTGNQVKPETLIRLGIEGCSKEQDDEEHTATEREKLDTDVRVEKQSQSDCSIPRETESKGGSPKKEPPPVKKKPTKVLKGVEPVSTDISLKEQDKEINASVTPEIDLPVEVTPTYTEDEIAVSVYDNDHEAGKSDIKTSPMLPVQVTMISKASPPSTPPPAYQPTPPQSRKTESIASVSGLQGELAKIQEDVSAYVEDTCWPPPPPPMEGDSVFDGGEEVDFPPPPPPLEMDNEQRVVDDSETERTLTTDQTADGENTEDSGEAGTPSHEQILELPADVSQIVMDTKSEGDMLPVSEGDYLEGNSCKPLQNVPSSDSVQPLPVEQLPFPTTRPEETVSVSVTLPSSDFRQNSVKIEDHSPFGATFDAGPPNVAPAAPPPPSENLTHGVSFRRQPSAANRDTRNKELLSRHKSVPTPKEDANIPLVTPSLLQMVRLRSVSMTEDQMNIPPEDKSTTQEPPVPENSPTAIPGILSTPQKPIRKSLSLKSPSQTIRATSITPNAPSMRLQEAIRMKTAAMSSRDGPPSRLGVKTSFHRSTGDPGAVVLQPPELCNMYRSPASTASFIFSKSSKKVIIDTVLPSSPEAQANLKQNLTIELNQVSDPTRADSISVSRSDKVPPPVAKKPNQGNAFSAQMNPANTNPTGKEHGPVQGQPIPLPETTTRVTADTIETLF